MSLRNDPTDTRPQVADTLLAMGRARATKEFLPDPVPDEVIDWLLWAATRAPSPVNTQGWDFVVVRDASQRQRLGEALSSIAGLMDASLRADDPATLRIMDGTKHLAANFSQVPVIVIVVGSLIYPAASPKPRYTYSATYSAAQNLIVAASSFGLGAAFTTMHEAAEPAFREILGIPADRIIAVTIPIGWPARELKPVRRKSVERVVHRDRW